jgi:hypothetical protein
MKQFVDGQEIVSRFNEDEAVWREYQYLRRLPRRIWLSGALPNSLLDRIDWLMAERQHRIVRCIGRALS